MIIRFFGTNAFLQLMILVGAVFCFSATAAVPLKISAMSFNVRWDGLDTGRNAWTNRLTARAGLGGAVDY